MTDFLLELRSEEIPARMQDKAREDLARLFAAELARPARRDRNRHLRHAAPPRADRARPADRNAGGQRRAEGPKANAPEQALAGFLRKTGLTRDQLTERDGVLYASPKSPAAPPPPCSPRRSPRSSAPSPGRSRCAGAPPPPRPNRCAGSARCTASSRCSAKPSSTSRSPASARASPPTATASTIRPDHIGSAADYVEKLRACHVIVDQDERRALIRDRATRSPPMRA